MSAASFVPYCGQAPIPGGETWNADPVLISALLGVGLLYAVGCRGPQAPAPWRRAAFAAGLLVASGAFLSPLCNLSVALFSARVTQHIMLTLVAAPLLALGRPERVAIALMPRSWASPRLWRRLAVGFGGPAFALAMWTWHMPGPYDATLQNNFVYWVMHVTIFGSAIVLWSALLLDDMNSSGAALVIACGTGIQMSLLGAVLTLAPRALFSAHEFTTWPWGLSPLQDQQLGGIIMWVPAGVLFTIYSVAGFGAWLNASASRSIGPRPAWDEAVGKV